MWFNIPRLSVVEWGQSADISGVVYLASSPHPETCTVLTVTDQKWIDAHSSSDFFGVGIVVDMALKLGVKQYCQLTCV